MPKIEKDKPFIIAGIPAYNEEKTIAKVIIQAMEYVDKVIVCDDGSTDMTAKIAEKLGTITLSHKKNEGKGAALRTIFNHAKTLYPDVIITIDADGQHRCEEIPKLIRPILRKKADMTIGSRYVDGGKTDASLYRRFGLSIINQLIKKINKVPIKDTQCGFRAYNQKALETVSKLEINGYGVETEQISVAFKKRLKVIEIPVNVKYKGIENPSKKPSIKHGSELIVNILKKTIEKRPLLYLGVTGTILLIFSAGSGIYLIWQFNKTRYFSMPIAMLMLGTIFIGMTLITAALIPYTIGRIREKLDKKEQLS